MSLPRATFVSALEQHQVSTACESGRVMATFTTRPLPQAVLTVRRTQAARSSGEQGLFGGVPAGFDQRQLLLFGELKVCRLDPEIVYKDAPLNIVRIAHQQIALNIYDGFVDFADEAEQVLDLIDGGWLRLSR